jgi:hypothetical protein
MPCFWSLLQDMLVDFLVELPVRCPALHYPSVPLPGPTSHVHIQPVTDARPTSVRPLSTLQMARHCQVLLGTLRTRRSPGGGKDSKWTCSGGPGTGKDSKWTCRGGPAIGKDAKWTCRGGPGTDKDEKWTWRCGPKWPDHW